MPSRFPGMDPYLEHPTLFRGLHNRLITRLSEVLQAALPEPYYAEIAERTWVEVSSGDIERDVIVLRGDGPSKPQAERVAVASQRGPLVVTVPIAEMPVVDDREIWVEIRAGVDGREHWKIRCRPRWPFRSCPATPTYRSTFKPCSITATTPAPIGTAFAMVKMRSSRR